MKVLARLLVLAVSFGINLPACHSGDGGSTPKAAKKGGGEMRTFYVGRFAMDVPVEMKQVVQINKLRYSTLEDFLWTPGTDREKVREHVWEKRVEEIKQLKPPENHRSTIISTTTLPGIGEWSRGIFYYGNYMDDEVANLDLLVDFGAVALWIRCDSSIWTPENEVKIRKNVNNIVKAYKNPPSSGKPTPGLYHLKYGALVLPYLRQERTFVRFEGHPLNLKLEVDMNETFEVEDVSLAQRLAASITTRYAPGVDVDKIRSRTRTAAGCKGEELVTRMSASGEDAQIHFFWEYRGKVDSGEHPEIQITMETPDVDLKKKEEIWDLILDSLKPMYR